MSADWNPRYQAYAHAHGEADAEAMLAADRERYPGGCMTGFVLWLRERWDEFFHATDGEVPSSNDRALAVYHHEKSFDTWVTTSFPAPV
jgi:hypothetical protein